MAKWLFQVLVICTVTVWWAVWVMPTSKPRVIVCDVGQGDAILVTKGTFQLLIDGGPDDRVLDCLQKYLPFYDRRLELVLMTHPDADHLTGLVEVFKRFAVGQFVRLPVSKDTQIYQQLQRMVTNIDQVAVFSGDRLKLGNTGLMLDIVWPTKIYFDQAINNRLEVNLLSIVAILSFGETEIILTGDADSQVALAQLATGLLKEVEILKVPHHGSKTAMLRPWLEVISPELALISVGRHNRYDHPRPETLEMLQSLDIPVVRTDLSGDIIIDLDHLIYKVHY